MAGIKKKKNISRVDNFLNDLVSVILGALELKFARINQIIEALYNMHIHSTIIELCSYELGADASTTESYPRFDVFSGIEYRH